MGEAKASKRSSNKHDWDTKSDTSEATVSTAASTACFCSDEVRSLAVAQAAKDKEVLKFVKVLREIAKLEGRQDLDMLRKAKVARKAELEEELNRVRGLAEARARNDLRQQSAAAPSDDFGSL